MRGFGLTRWISWLWPIRETQVEGRSGPLEVRWENGRLVVNSAQGNQSFGSLHRVWQRILDQVVDRERPPANVLLLGLGGGSAVHILRKEMGLTTPITAVEWDPAMISLAKEYFALEGFKELTVVEGDATIQLHSKVSGQRTRYELILVDLFDDLDLARGVEAMPFIHGLRDACSPSGVVCFNTVSFDEASEKRCELVRERLQRVFNKVEEVRLEEVNRVFLAR